MGEGVHHLADHSFASVTVERWIEGVDDSVVWLTGGLPVVSDLLVVGDVVGDAGQAVVLGAGEDFVVADASVTSGVGGLADRGDVESALAQLVCDCGRPHLVPEQLHAADWVGVSCPMMRRSCSAACSFAWMRASISSG
jgi:hypothetical protein